jgi:hypothetical protein
MLRDRITRNDTIPICVVIGARATRNSERVALCFFP